MFPQLKSVGRYGIRGTKLIPEGKARRVVEGILLAAAKDAEEKLNDVVGTWEHNVVIHISEVKWTPSASIEIWTDDKIFWWLDNGVPKHAKMYPNFVRKTTPAAGGKATFKSGTGGGTRYPKTVYKEPIGNIESRGWIDELSKTSSRTMFDISKNMFRDWVSSLFKRGNK